MDNMNTFSTFTFQDLFNGILGAQFGLCLLLALSSQKYGTSLLQNVNAVH
jgi:hypothetical protein